MIFEDGSESLSHHGIKGMKWGVWNAETAAKYKGGDNSTIRGARKTASAANKLDMRRAVEIGKAQKENKEAFKAGIKADKYRAKGDYKTAHGYDVLRVAYGIRRDTHLDAADGIQRSRNALVRDLKKAGGPYQVNISNVSRSTVSSGEALLMGVLGGPVVSSTVSGSKANSVQGQHVTISRKH